MGYYDRVLSDLYMTLVNIASPSSFRGKTTHFEVHRECPTYIRLTRLVYGNALYRLLPRIDFQMFSRCHINTLGIITIVRSAR